MNSLYGDQEAGRKAAELIDSLVPYFNIIEAGLVDQFKKCPVRDEQGLVLIQLHFKVMEALKMHLNSVVATGKMAEIDLSKVENSNV